MAIELQDTDASLRMVEALAALGDERRFAVVELLAGGERCLCEISAALGISNALASHHVKRLRTAGIVVTRRAGAWVHCKLSTRALAFVARQLDELAVRSASVRAVVCCGAEELETDE